MLARTLTPHKTAAVHSFCRIRRISTMLELRTRQREILIDKLPDVANLAAGALVFGQFIGSETFSPSTASVDILFGGIALFAGTITLYDYISRRVNRRAHKH
jgi:hypothetical protein